ncbi:MAG: hypothetical protein M1820_001927 [Bogoriella megaspora]|nr:MAG: hypothetical protein M1820_001927 [Bogoriella megaspora]
MNNLEIKTKIGSLYQVFDASGKLPFSIVFGLSRQSPADTDPRPLLVDIAGSVLDVPYALAHGLLTWHERDEKDDGKWIEVDVSRLSGVAAKEAGCLSLPSVAEREEHRMDDYTMYQCHIDADGELASILELGKNYMIRLACEDLNVSEDIGVKRWAYDGEQLPDSDGDTDHKADAVKGVSGIFGGGNANFTVVKSLSWPPRIETKMRLCASLPPSDPALMSAKLSSDFILEISVNNTGSDSITVQTRGFQFHLNRRDDLNSRHDPNEDDYRTPRIIDTTTNEPYLESLQVVNSATGQVLGEKKQRGEGPYVHYRTSRPSVEDVVTLKPGVLLVREIDIRAKFEGLEDGQYKIQMQPRVCRWWHGEIRQEADRDGRIPKHLLMVFNPALMLESQDEPELRIRDGKLDQSM